MVIALVAAITAVAAAAVAAVVYRSAWRTVRRRRVVVVLEDGVSVTGILWRSAGALLVIRDAAIHAEHTTPVAGELVIERGKVQWLQVVP